MTEQDPTGSLYALVERWREASRLNAAMAKSLDPYQQSSKLVYEVRADELAKLALELEKTLKAQPTIESAKMIEELRRVLRKINDHLDHAQSEVERALDGMGDVIR